jgi:hypothetical protein
MLRTIWDGSMTRRKPGFLALLFCLIAGLAAIPARPTPATHSRTYVQDKQGQAKEEPKEIKDIKDLLKKVKEAEKAGKDDEVKKLKKEIIKKVDDYYKIPKDNVDGDPEYDPNYDGDGKSEKSGKKVKVTLGEKTFTTPGWIASTKLHEMVGHGGQAAGDRWYEGAKGDAINDIEAYDLEIENAKKNGLTDDEIAELKRRRDQLYDGLNEENKKKMDEKDYTMAFAEPSHRSVGELAGKAQVFVAGEVTAEETMMVTVRGPRTVEGLVVTAEAGGKKVETRTDAQGHAILDFAAIGAGLATATVALVHVTDSNGNPISEGRTTIQPGSPGLPTRPQVSEFPKNVRSGDVVTMPGKSIGADCQLIVGNHQQEVLSASSREMTAFVDAPTVGPQPVYLLSSAGESQSKTVNFYTFNVQASKNTITRGEHITVTANYAGLPPGTEVAFTNMTPEIVRMNAHGAAPGQGAKSVVKTANPSGVITLDLVGESAGKFVITYDLHFPQ